jgi:hypothetical protein
MMNQGHRQRNGSNPLEEYTLNTEQTEAGQQYESPPNALQRAQAQWRSLLSRPDPPTVEDAPRRVTTLSIENSRQNNPWADECQGKGNNITRVNAINLNGLQFDAKGGKFDSVCRSIKDLQVDVFCGQEHNVDTTLPSV